MVSGILFCLSLLGGRNFRPPCFKVKDALDWSPVMLRDTAASEVNGVAEQQKLVELLRDLLLLRRMASDRHRDISGLVCVWPSRVHIQLVLSMQDCTTVMCQNGSKKRCFKYGL